MSASLAPSGRRGGLEHEKRTWLTATRTASNRILVETFVKRSCAIWEVPCSGYTGVAHPPEAPATLPLPPHRPGAPQRNLPAKLHQEGVYRPEAETGSVSHEIMQAGLFGKAARSRQPPPTCVVVVLDRSHGQQATRGPDPVRAPSEGSLPVCGLGGPFNLLAPLSPPPTRPSEASPTRCPPGPQRPCRLAGSDGHRSTGPAGSRPR